LFATPATDHLQRRLLAGTIERAAYNVPVDGHNTLTLLREPGHEALKRGAKLRRFELSEQPAEGIVVGDAVGQLQKAEQERLFGFGELRHVNRAMAAAQNSAERSSEVHENHDSSGIAASRILQAFPATDKLFHTISTARLFHPPW
jgi:hypothetical protein